MFWSRSSERGKVEFGIMIGSSRWRVGLVVAFLGATVGCAGKQQAAARGEDCYRDDDCQVGLVCVADRAGNRVCSSDVSSLSSMVDGPPPDAGTPTDDAGTQ
jgi:hypothetical protein